MAHFTPALSCTFQRANSRKSLLTLHLSMLLALGLSACAGDYQTKGHTPPATVSNRSGEYFNGLPVYHLAPVQVTASRKSEANDAVARAAAKPQ